MFLIFSNLCNAGIPVVMLFAMATDAKKVIVMAGALVKIKYKLSYININLEQNMNMNMNLSSHVVGKTRSLVTHVPSDTVYSVLITGSHTHCSPILSCCYRGK